MISAFSNPFEETAAGEGVTLFSRVATPDLAVVSQYYITSLVACQSIVLFHHLFLFSAQSSCDHVQV
jgi:hypothetical protein